ncbi:hypothetical protein SEA_NICEHOUSE_83 [Rhodococcus phage NiceHouse]|nr:hypothetical protein SEA_NICEHOUSE_83 [Rhodococcus phage NiceHouse]
MQMKRFIPFSERIEDAENLDITDILVHSMSYLDAAAALAVKEQDSNLLVDIFNESLKASDRLTSVVLHLEEMGENEDESIDLTEQSEFGFRPAKGECEPEEDDQ